MDWSELVPRLMLHAKWIHRRMLSDVPGAPEPEDLVQAVIEKVLVGQRSLPDPEEVPTSRALEMVMRSEADNARQRAMRRGEGRLDEASLAVVDPRDSPDRLPQVAAMWRLIRARIKDDPEMLMVSRSLEADPEARPDRIAEQTGMSVSHVHRVMRRLRYRLQAVEIGLRDLLGE